MSDVLAGWAEAAVTDLEVFCDGVSKDSTVRSFVQVTYRIMMEVRSTPDTRYL